LIEFFIVVVDVVDFTHTDILDIFSLPYNSSWLFAQNV
jgi:hypothetical protein